MDPKSAAGASFGWFSWLSVATTAPIEVMAMIGYADHYSCGPGVRGRPGPADGSGLVVAVLLMAVFCGINLMGIKTLARADNAATWWKIGVPMLVVLLLAVVSFHPTTFTAGGGFAPFGAKAPLAFGAFRSRLPDAARPFRLKAGGVLSPAAFVVANLIIFWSGWDTVWTLGVAVGIGCLLLAVARLLRTNPVAVRLDVRAAQWLPVHLAGTGLITWVSDFGPWAYPWLPFGWDMAAGAVFSVAVYAWAVAVALPGERIEALIRETQDPADPAEPAETPA